MWSLAPEVPLPRLSQVLWSALSPSPQLTSQGDTTVFVGGLSPKATEDGLARFFEQRVGPVERVKIVCDRESGRSKGYGFITFLRPDHASSARDMTSLVFLGKTLNVGVAYRKHPPAPNLSTAGARPPLYPLPPVPLYYAPPYGYWMPPGYGMGVEMPHPVEYPLSVFPYPLLQPFQHLALQDPPTPNDPLPTPTPTPSPPPPTPPSPLPSGDEGGGGQEEKEAKAQ